MIILVPLPFWHKLVNLFFVNVIIVVPLPFRHKLVNLFFAQSFEKLFNICVKILIKLKFSLLDLNQIRARIVNQNLHFQV